MKELYEKGVASHLGPESCALPREGQGEALTGVRAGRAIEPRKCDIRGADAVVPAEGKRTSSANASCLPPRGVEDPGMRENSSHGNREIP